MAVVLDDGQDLEPWRDPAFRADLAAYAEGEAENARRYARDVRLLARMASHVPRAAWDTRGATAWTSFLAELAVARRTSTQFAATVVADALQLVRLMPATLGLLEQGVLVVSRARALLEAARPCDDDLVRTVDRDLAGRACDLPPARIRSAVDRLALQYGVDAAAARSATAAAGRGTRRTPLPDGQSELALIGPALVLAQAQAALDADARTWLAALRGTGDTRGVDQLRFDLGVHRLLGRHAPVVRREAVPSSAGAQEQQGARAAGRERATPPAPAGPAGPSGPAGAAPAGPAGPSGPAGAAPAVPAVPAAPARVAATPRDASATGMPPAAPVCTRPAGGSAEPPSNGPTDVPGDVAAVLPDPTSPSWWTDRRFSRPVRLDLAVPVTTALGLSDEPGWLPSYGWISPPQVRQLLPVAELRQACVAADGPAAGQLVDLSDRVVRPGTTAAEARAAVLEMATRPFDVTEKTWGAEPHHDPGPALAEFVRLRDRHCDGPVSARPLRASEADLDHDKLYADLGELQDDVRPRSEAARPEEDRPQEDAAPMHDGGGGRPPRTGRPSWRVNDAVAWAAHGDTGLDLDPATGLLTLVDLGHEDVRVLAQPSATGPTAAWNLVGRSRRVHGLKHRGWTPLRTATSTLWFTPAGQMLEVPHELDPVAGVRADPPLRDAQALHDEEAALLASGRVLPSLESDDDKAPVVEATRLLQPPDVDVPAPF